MVRKFAAALYCAASLFGATSASAAVVIGAPIVVASTGNVTATFVGSDASLQSQLGLVGGPSLIFDNAVNAPGDTFDLGNFTAGTVLTFSLNVLGTGNVFFSGPGAGNPDGIPHAGVETLAGFTRVGFEDIFGGGDEDYNDLIFTFTNTVVPEPASWAMMIGGFGLVGAAARRRTKVTVKYA